MAGPTDTVENLDVVGEFVEDKVALNFIPINPGSIDDPNVGSMGLLEASNLFAATVSGLSNIATHHDQPNVRFDSEASLVAAQSHSATLERVDNTDATLSFSAEPLSPLQFDSQASITAPKALPFDIFNGLTSHLQGIVSPVSDPLLLNGKDILLKQLQQEDSPAAKALEDAGFDPRNFTAYLTRGKDNLVNVEAESLLGGERELVMSISLSQPATVLTQGLEANVLPENRRR